MNIWQYDGSDFTHEIAQSKIEEGYIGFVYIITDISTGIKYIGKKLLISRKKLPPLKGQKKKRNKIVETDWAIYHGSSETVKELVLLRPDDFHREIICFAKMKGELNYLEAKIQFERDALIRPREFHNCIIACKIHRNHVRSLWQ